MPSLPVLPRTLSASVGAPGKAQNVLADVRFIQHLFNLITPESASRLVEDGKCGPLLLRRISDYQANRLKVSKPDGVIDPGGRTFNSLVDDAGKANAVVLPDQSLVTRPTCDGQIALTEADFQRAAATLGNGISVNLIKAFAAVESGGRSGFGPSNMPVIAFEGHIFRKYTQHKYDRTYPFLSYPFLVNAGPQWKANNKTQAIAWRTLVDAYTLDQAAALMSASYGMFQVMGFNFAACGYKNVFEFVAALKLNAGQQLMAFCGFCRKNPALLRAMKSKDFAGMARNYNGSSYGDYDRRIQKAFEALERKK
ncbi:N-acetylmuramidase family protein [Pseudomonas sp. B19125]|uniref:N-acetylmuramidase family protein n=1 Tax=Pseudomonas sp. B19125 TaxID=3235109 RepID=UPI003782D317